LSLRVDVHENARIAVLSLRANRMRTGLTTIGIGIGVATLLAIVGIIQGLNSSFSQQLASMGSSSIYVSKWPMVTMGDWWKYRNRADLTLKHLEAVRAQATHAAYAIPLVQTTLDVTAGEGQLSNVDVTGSSEGYLEVSAFTLAEGRFLTPADDSTRSAVAVVGDDVAKGLFPGLSPVGQSIRIDNKPFRIVGVLERKGKFLDESQDLLAVIPYHSFRSILGSRRSISIGVVAHAPEQVELLEDQLQGIMRRARQTPAGTPDDFNLNRPDQLANTYEQLTGALFGVAVGIGFITLLVGGIGIMNIMLVSVRERTREIGIRRALGARKRTIVLQFLLEASAVSAFGGALGTAVGLGTARVVAEISPLAATVEPGTVAGGIIFAGLVGLIFGIWPAARAANLDPVEALRYE
jgi:putative ABC transport system permease protein